jgi:hypothetical protein
MSLDDKIKIADKLRGGMAAGAAGLTSPSYYILKSIFLLICCFNA